jgi:hypothetical protein
VGKDLGRSQCIEEHVFKMLTLRIRDKASSLKPLMALLPRVFRITLSFFPPQSQFAPGSTMKNGPMAIYTAWIIIESDIAIFSAQTRLLTRGKTAESA